MKPCSAEQMEVFGDRLSSHHLNPFIDSAVHNAHSILLPCVQFPPSTPFHSIYVSSFMHQHLSFHLMGHFLRVVAFLIKVAATCFVMSVHAAPVITTIAEEPFAYSGGVSIGGLNGGSGWSAAWTAGVRQHRTNATSLTLLGLSSSGGKLVDNGNAAQVSFNDRILPMQSSGVVFVQFMAQFGTQSGNGTPQIRLFNSVTNANAAAVGNNARCGSPVFALFGPDLVTGPCSAVALSSLSVIVLRIDYTATSTSMWVLPDFSGFDYLNPPTPTAVYAGLAVPFDTVQVVTRAPAMLDELRIFTVAAAPAPVQPTPVPFMSWTALGLLSGLVGLLGWRRAGIFGLDRRTGCG